MMRWDVFISHAREDKDEVARPLTRLLQEAGLKVWLDENELSIGDSLSRKIDEGLAQSEFGVVILSKYFFAKPWPPHELAGLVARQVGGKKVILPVWHGVDREFVLGYSPTLADALAVSTDQGLSAVATAVIGAVRRDQVPIPHGSRSPKQERSWFLILLTLVVAAAGMIWDDSAMYGSKIHNFKEDALIFGRVMPAYGVIASLWNFIGIPANVLLAIGGGLVIGNRERGSTLIRVTCYVMLSSVTLLCAMFWNLRSETDNPTYLAVLQTTITVCFFSLSKWGLLLLLHRNRRNVYSM